MNWEAIGAFAESAGAVAVVASLLFVGYQLRQAQSIERAKAQRDLLIQAREWMSLLSSDEQLFEAVRTCLRDFEDSGDFEKEQFNSWAFSFLFMFEQVYYMHEDGYVNQGSFDRFEQGILSIIRTPGGAKWRSIAHGIVGTDVGEYLVDRMNTMGQSVTPWDELLPHHKANSTA